MTFPCRRLWHRLKSSERRSVAFLELLARSAWTWIVSSDGGPIDVSGRGGAIQRTRAPGADNHGVLSHANIRRRRLIRTDVDDFLLPLCLAFRSRRVFQYAKRVVTLAWRRR